MVIRISTAGKEEAGVIADMSIRTFANTFAPYNTAENMEYFLRTQFTREILMEQVGAPRNEFLLAWLDDRLAGYARLYDNPELPRELSGTRAIEVSRFYAEEFAIGKGVGKALMDACFELSRKREMEWIWLGVWENNHRAIAFYEKMGFQIFSRHIFLLGRDVQHDWEMKRKL
ncbi:MAG TPA: GNAT family N-acetyltransferase [Puia sp.]|nr:GNAT family N-acetyltransferase [Puia sp.]